MAPDDARYEHGRLELSRVANPSDAVFAIAMTLPVLTLDVPRPGRDGPAGTLLEQMPQLIAFVLAFALVANLWWQHHEPSPRPFARHQGRHSAVRPYTARNQPWTLKAEPEVDHP